MHENPLCFWVESTSRHVFVDLSSFAEGKFYKSRFASYSGRPNLILQLAHEIKVALTGLSEYSIHGMIGFIRSWFRIFDAVELLQNVSAEDVVRLDDVRDLSIIHYDYASRSGMNPDAFTWFLRVVNLTLEKLGSPKIYWESPEGKAVTRRLPSEEQISLIRHGLKQAWFSVAKRWDLMESVQSLSFDPKTDDEERRVHELIVLRGAQQRSGLEVPTVNDLINGSTREGFRYRTGVLFPRLWNDNFINRWDVYTAFHMCLATTGFNLSVLMGLDATNPELWLYDHPSDANRFVLIGQKQRSGGKDVPIVGLWKTKFAAGHIIREVLRKNKGIRSQLLERLSEEKQKLNELALSPNADLGEQYELVQKLEVGVKSVWLFLDKYGGIRWIKDYTFIIYSGSEYKSYMCLLIEGINNDLRLMEKEPVPFVTASDFRDMFALYVWRQTGGNILQVMRVLAHTQVATTQKYLDNNVTNFERDEQIRTFQEALISELRNGRLDLTIISHLNRYGVVTTEMQARLDKYRSLKLSRIGIACVDPESPPSHTQEKGKFRCSSQRCLICPENARILPESIDGIAMRAEELIRMKKMLPMEAWLVSDFEVELLNAESALESFGAAKSAELRKKWKDLIEVGDHIVPGL
ncbi:hypothetical protein FBY04_12287 [Pseudomonas sp. SJZ080]|nr:hypothetical protein FBY04_12287 [Pseudomonas sp. SJZ080]